MNPLTAPVSARGGATSEFKELLTPDALSALMRSTWTWDDRALRRDLAALLVDLDAARAVAESADSPAGRARAGTLESRALASGASFVAAVLGPKLISDNGNPLRKHFLRAAIDPAAFARAASAEFAMVREASPAYIAARTHDVEYPSPRTGSI